MIQNLADHLNQPLTLGGKTIPCRLVMAPMTQLGHVAHRRLVAAYGGFGLLFSEMCAARRLPHENRKLSACFKWDPGEVGHLVWQIIGSEPAEMAAGARRIEQEGFFGVDINCSCSMTAICRRNWGAALLRSPERAFRMVAAVRKAVEIPLFVKFRTGWHDDPRHACEMAKGFQEAGADALTFHPRVAPDRRSRPPKWAYIAAVKRSVSIPVFGNGNLFSPRDGLKMIETTACDGLSVGRMAIARPWLFAQWTRGFQPSEDIYRTTARRLAELLDHHFDARRALRRYKRFMQYFAANFRFGHGLYGKVANLESLPEVAAVVDRFLETPPELNPRPNLNLFI